MKQHHRTDSKPPNKQLPTVRSQFRKDLAEDPANAKQPRGESDWHESIEAI
jgi:hypothetical protein